MELNEFERAVLKTVRINQERGISPEETERLFNTLAGREGETQEETQEETAIIKEDAMTREGTVEIKSSQGTVFVNPNYAIYDSREKQPVEHVSVSTPQVETLGIKTK